MLKVGLTGGIACGKTTSLSEFERLGVFGIDADQIAHKMILPGGPAYGEIVDMFGNEILKDNRVIDRKRLAMIIFQDESKREKLNQIVHPHVLTEQERILCTLEKNIGTYQPKIAMVDAALMIEAGTYRRYDVILVVYCNQEPQLRRLMTRDSLGENEALIRINSQMSLAEKVRYADSVIDNSNGLNDTRRQIQNIFSDLKSRP